MAIYRPPKHKPFSFVGGLWLRWVLSAGAISGTISDKVATEVGAALQLLCTADRYGIVPLKHHLTPIIAGEVIVDNVINVLETADRLHAFQLRRHCLDYILIHFQEVKDATDCFQDLLTAETRHLMTLILRFLSSPMQAPPALSPLKDRAAKQMA